MLNGPSATLLTTWEHWFASDAIGIVIVAPLVIAPPQIQYSPNSDLALNSCPSASASTGCGFFDGNVAATVQSVGVFAAKTLGTAYQYDQLYRLIGSAPSTDPGIGPSRPSLSGSSRPTGPGAPSPSPLSLDPPLPSYEWPATSTDPHLWRTQIKYDENGNITALNRDAPDSPGVPTARAVERLTYHYPLDANGKLAANRLLHINNNQPPLPYPVLPYPENLADQGAFDPTNPVNPNYSYDLNGRLIGDRSAGLNKITWNAASRVTTIERTNDTLEFVYDGLGNRITKVTRSGPNPPQYEYFVRDEKGEVLATYKASAPTAPSTTSNIVLADQTILGASRLGNWVPADPPWGPVALGTPAPSSSSPAWSATTN